MCCADTLLSTECALGVGDAARVLILHLIGFSRFPFFSRVAITSLWACPAPNPILSFLTVLFEDFR